MNEREFYIRKQHQVEFLEREVMRAYDALGEVLNPPLTSTERLGLTELLKKREKELNIAKSSIYGDDYKRG